MCVYGLLRRQTDSFRSYVRTFFLLCSLSGKKSEVNRAEVLQMCCYKHALMSLRLIAREKLIPSSGVGGILFWRDWFFFVWGRRMKINFIVELFTVVFKFVLKFE